MPPPRCCALLGLLSIVTPAAAASAVLSFSAPFEVGRSHMGGRLWQPYCRRLNQTAGKLPRPLPLPPSHPPGPPSPPPPAPPPPPTPSPAAAAGWLVEPSTAATGVAPGLCDTPCVLRSVAAYPTAYANVLDANVYLNENASNVCAAPRDVNYTNQVWLRVGNALQTEVRGVVFCLTGIVTDEPLASPARPPVRNMSAVVEPCVAGTVAQSWTLVTHADDSLLSIQWNGAASAESRRSPLCLTVVSATSPDLPGGAHDIRLEVCPPTHAPLLVPPVAFIAPPGAIYCQAEVCQDGAKDAWPAWSFLSIDDGRSFQLVGEVATYGPTAFASPKGDGGTAVLPYVVFADPDRRGVTCSGTVYTLDAHGMLHNYSFPVALSGFPRRLKTGPACNGNTCVNWWARRAVSLPNGDLLTMIGNLQWESNASAIPPGGRNLYSVASVVSSDGGRNWRFQTEIRTEPCLTTAPCMADQIDNSATLEGPV
jgi:hypothetical protein